MTAEKPPVVVLGGTGFIGRALLHRLLAAGHRTTALVFGDRGQRDRLPVLKGLHVVEAASSRPADLAAAVGGVAGSVVINLAASGVRPEDRNPAALTAGNRGVLEDVLAALAAAPPRLFLHAGSWSAYAPAANAARITEDAPLRNDAGYGGAKADAERAGRALSAKLGVPFVTLRLFHVYGPGEANHRLFPTVVERLAAGRPVDLTPGDQVRDFLYVDAAADAFIAAATAPDLAAHDAYNVCSGEPVTVRRVVEAIGVAMGRPQEFLRFGALPRRDDEPSRMVGDNSRLRKATGWRPVISLDDGIKRTLDEALGGRRARLG